MLKAGGEVNKGRQLNRELGGKSQRVQPQSLLSQRDKPKLHPRSDLKGCALEGQ